LVLGTEPGWQKAAAGGRFETGEDGTALFTVHAPLHRGARKRPTNFFDSLFSGKEATDDLQIAVELVYAEAPLLYVATVHRFVRDGTVLLGDTAVFAKDAQGDFTRPVPRSKDGGWLLPQFGGLAVTGPGHEIAGFLFLPREKDQSGKSWVLNCQYKRSLPPMRR
jgi:hypothetical protein